MFTSLTRCFKILFSLIKNSFSVVKLPILNLQASKSGRSVICFSFEGGGVFESSGDEVFRVGAGSASIGPLFDFQLDVLLSGAGLIK